MHRTENNLAPQVTNESDRIRILESYARTFRKITWRMGIVITLLGSAIWGFGNGLSKTASQNADPLQTVDAGRMLTVDPNQIFTISGIVTGIAGLLIMFLPQVPQKDFRR